MSPLFPTSHMLNSKGLLLYCALTPKLVMYVDVKGTPQHCQTFLVKVSYDSKVWLLLALRLGRGDYNLNLIPAFPARTLGFFGALQSASQYTPDPFRLARRKVGRCVMSGTPVESPSILCVHALARAHQAPASFCLTVITSFFLSRTELYVASSFFLITLPCR